LETQANIVATAVAIITLVRFIVLVFIWGLVFLFPAGFNSTTGGPEQAKNLAGREILRLIQIRLISVEFEKIDATLSRTLSSAVGSHLSMPIGYDRERELSDREGQRENSSVDSRGVDL
jgi:hypothetical protein